MSITLKNIIRTDAVKQNGECPICIRITYGRKFYRYPLNESIKPEYWNSEEGMPKKNCPRKELIKTLLYSENARINEAINSFYITNNKKYPTLEELKKLIRSGKKTNEIKGVMDYFAEFKEEYQKKKGLLHETMKSYNGAEQRLIEFYRDTNTTPTWEGFNKDFNDDFLNFYINKGQSEGYIGRLIKNIKTFLTYINENYKLVNKEQVNSLKVIKEEPDFVTLNKADLLMIKYHLGLIPTKSEDWFDLHEVQLSNKEKSLLRILLFLCFTGMSYVDFQKLTYLDIENNDDLETYEVLSFTYARQKTNLALKVIITITDDLIDLLFNELQQYSNKLLNKLKNNNRVHKMSLPMKIEILKNTIKEFSEESYIKTNNYISKNKKMSHFPKLFQSVSNQEFNREIKEVLKKIGLTEKVKIFRKRNRKNEPLEFQKYELITSVTGRRTFITISLQDNIPMPVLMKATGHKDIRTLMRYAKIDTNIVNKEFIDKKKKIVPNDNWENRKIKSLKTKPTPPPK